MDSKLQELIERGCEIKQVTPIGECVVYTLHSPQGEAAFVRDCAGEWEVQSFPGDWFRA